ncbi:MAG: efflux RND transporter periplasmic adaptor subunit [Acidobacteria bacterium]|nr:MAG: efflux RND transporter periplasmic adaptor subunit [Acidobacteriota bacterium]
MIIQPRSPVAAVAEDSLQRRGALLASLVFLSSLIALFTACSKEKAEETAVPVKAATVEKTAIQRIVAADAVLFPLQQSALVPKVSAPVKAFYVNRGAKVHKGQLLAVLENKDLAAAQEENKGAYEQAEAAYVTGTTSSVPEELQKAKGDAQAAKEQLDAAQKLYDSRLDLFKQGALPRKDLDQAAVALAQAKPQYELAQRHLDSLNAVVHQQELKGLQGQLSSAKGKYQGAAAQLSYSEIRSPLNGVVTDRPLYPGEMAPAGAALMTVMDLSRVTARAHIPQSDAVLLKLGDAATIAIPGQEEPVEGKVTLVSPALDPNSTTVEVWVEAKNPKQTLRPGSSVRLSMISQSVPDALVIPAASLLTGSDGATTVMLIGDDQHAHQQAVKVGIRQDDKLQIIEGVKEGQHVVTEGAYGLPDNAKVSVEAPAEAGKDKDAEKPAAGKNSKDSKDEKQ